MKEVFNSVQEEMENNLEFLMFSGLTITRLNVFISLYKYYGEQGIRDAYRAKEKEMIEKFEKIYNRYCLSISAVSKCDEIILRSKLSNISRSVSEYVRRSEYMPEEVLQCCIEFITDKFVKEHVQFKEGGEE